MAWGERASRVVLLLAGIACVSCAMSLSSLPQVLETASTSCAEAFIRDPATGCSALAGCTFGNLTTSSSPALGQGDGLLAVYESSMMLRWARLLGTSDHDCIIDATFAGDKLVAVARRSFPLLSYMHESCLVFYVVDVMNGTVLTQWEWNPPAQSVDPWAVHASADGSSLYLTGALSDRCAAFPCTRVPGDGFLSKWTLGGDESWRFTLGPAGSFNHGRLVVDTVTDEVFVTGPSVSGLPSDVGNRGAHSTQDARSAIPTHSGYYLAKFTSSGVSLWSMDVGLGPGDLVTGMALGADGTVYLAGYSLEGSSSVSDTAFVMQVYGNSVPGWTTRFGGPDRMLTVRGIAVAPDLSLRVVGEIGGTVLGFDHFSSYMLALDASGSQMWLSELDELLPQVHYLAGLHVEPSNVHLTYLAGGMRTSNNEAVRLFATRVNTECTAGSCAQAWVWPLSVTALMIVGGIIVMGLTSIATVLVVRRNAFAGSGDSRSRRRRAAEAAAAAAKAAAAKQATPLSAAEDANRVRFYRQSKALLIGVSEYESKMFPSLSNVNGNLRGMSECLNDAGFQVTTLPDLAPVTSPRRNTAQHGAQSGTGADSSGDERVGSAGGALRRRVSSSTRRRRRSSDRSDSIGSPSSLGASPLARASRLSSRSLGLFSSASGGSSGGGGSSNGGGAPVPVVTVADGDGSVGDAGGSGSDGKAAARRSSAASSFVASGGRSDSDALRVKKPMRRPDHGLGARHGSSGSSRGRVVSTASAGSSRSSTLTSRGSSRATESSPRKQRRRPAGRKVHHKKAVEQRSDRSRSDLSRGSRHSLASLSSRNSAHSSHVVGVVKRSSILQALDRLLDTMTSEDRLLLYFAGHGVTIDTPNGGKVGMLVTSDTYPSNVRTYLQQSDLVQLLRAKANYKHCLLIIDSCFSGWVLHEPYSGAAVLEKALRHTSLQAMTAGNTEQTVTGELTRSILHHLHRFENGCLPVQTLFSDVKLTVMAKTDERQTPQLGYLTYDTTGTFLFFRLLVHVRHTADPSTSRPVLVHEPSLAAVRRAIADAFADVSKGELPQALCLVLRDDATGDEVYQSIDKELDVVRLTQRSIIEFDMDPEPPVPEAVMEEPEPPAPAPAPWYSGIMNKLARTSSFSSFVSSSSRPSQRSATPTRASLETQSARSSDSSQRSSGRTTKQLVRETGRRASRTSSPGVIARGSSAGSRTGSRRIRGHATSASARHSTSSAPLPPPRSTQASASGSALAASTPAAGRPESVRRSRSQSAGNMGSRSGSRRAGSVRSKGERRSRREPPPPRS